MNFKNLLSLLYISFFVSTARGKILVFEYKPEAASLKHVEDVVWSACGGQEVDCESVYSSAFDQGLFTSLTDKVKDFDVVNMSFGQVFMTEQELMIGEAVDPNFSASKYKEEFEVENTALQKLISDTEDVLFTVAAGNGKQTALGKSGGVALSSSYQSYPASFDLPNMITVASLEKSSVDHFDLEGHKLAPYSNFSVFDVDVAISPALDSKGELLYGTSFAAPVIARVAQNLKTKWPSIAARELKEVLIKSSYVVALDNAIEASKEYVNQGKESKLGRVHTVVVPSVLEKIKKELGGIVLVKSGGFVVESVSVRCVDLYVQGALTIEEACLQAHKEILSADTDRLDKLVTLWRLRGL